jgi:hypothetical protein
LIPRRDSLLAALLRLPSFRHWEDCEMASNQSTSGFQVFVRVFWMMIGPGILSILALTIAEGHKGWFAARSIAFLVVLIVVTIARRLDPLTPDGEPATQGDFRWYTVFTMSLGLAAWIFANLLGNHLLAR